MNFLFPLGLAALAAAIVPLLIHLARRTEQRPTDFAALRWLRQKPRPRHRPKFDELLLLAVRLLLIALLALLLARPVLPNGVDTRRVIAVAPGVADLPTDPAARRVWLAPGFPALDTPTPGPVPIASLIRELDADLPRGTALTIIVPATLTGADAERPRLSRPVDWRIVPGSMPAGATRPVPIRVALRVAADHQLAGRYIRAAIGALALTTDDAPFGRPIPTDATATIRLAAGPLSAATLGWIAAGGTALVTHDTIVPAGTMAPIWRDAEGTTLVEGGAQGRGRILRFTRTLAPAAMPPLVEADFPRQLQILLAPERAEPGRVAADAYRPSTGAAPSLPPSRDPIPWVALAIALGWLVERWLATRRRRAVMP